MATGLLLFSTWGWSWGRRGHEIVNERAIENLPEPLRAYFRSRAEYLVGHASDPDLLSENDPAEKPHHYTDADAYDRYPFPRLEMQFVRERRVPTAAEERNGDVIWQIETYTLRLSRDLQIKRWGDADHDAVFVAHYAADLTQPLHTVSNYDGQLTRQAGIHARFETELVAAISADLKLSPKPPVDVPDLRARIFAEYLASYRRSADILDADRRAVAGRTYLDPGYFPAFLKGAEPIAEERLSAAISLVSSLWYTAWDRAGRPPLPQEARPPAKSRQGK
jgi:S1/P1 nuclease